MRDPASIDSPRSWRVIPQSLKRNEKVLIEAFDAPDEMTIALVRAARNEERSLSCSCKGPGLAARVALDASEPQLRLLARHELARMKLMDAYIAVRGSPQYHRAGRRADRPDETNCKKK